MPRFPAANRATIPQEQADAFDAIVAARNGIVPEQGPVAVQLHVPEIARRGEILRAYLRAEGSSLPDNVQELAMLTTARELDCQFIWHAHGRRRTPRRPQRRPGGQPARPNGTAGTVRGGVRRHQLWPGSFSAPAAYPSPLLTPPAPLSATGDWWN